MRLLPRTLGVQLLALLLAALVVSFGVSFFLFYGDRAQAVREADRIGLLERIASVARILELSPVEERGALAEAAGSPRVRFWTSTDSAIPQSTSGGIVLTAMFRRMFSMPLREPPRLAMVAVDAPAEPPQPLPPTINRLWRLRDLDAFDVIASVPFRAGGWLNAQTRIRAETVPLPLPSLISAAVMALAIMAIVGIVARRVTRPLRALAEKADALGRGAASPPLEEQGPFEARRLIAAFNRMQDRLGRFIADRTRMLAAIGHDLRTPITSLKLRAELLDDAETKAKMLATLDEMQHMTEATLEFARDDAAAEPTRIVDLAALIESQVDDLAEMGKPVTFGEAERLPYPCRPNSLKRATANLVENAIAYGERARVSVERTPGGPVIRIDDDGPGIPEAQIEEVFKPFVRLEQSRNRTTGGAGLGLSIARSIVLSHGGELSLSNRPTGGLRAEIRLPQVDPGKAAST